MPEFNKLTERYQPTGKYVGKRAAKYRRLSTEKQEEGWSLEFQDELTGEAIALEECIFDKMHNYSDIHTGMEIFERPGLNALRAAAKRGEFNVLFVYKLDRFSRVGWQQEMIREELRRYGVTIVTLKKDEHADDNSPLGSVIRAFYSFKAEEERNDIIQRTHDGAMAKAKKGYLIGTGKALYGYRWNANGKERTHYVIHTDEAAIVYRIFQMAKQGMSMRRIAIILTEERIPSPGGRDIWRASAVTWILSNSFYIGKATLFKRKQVKEPGNNKKHLVTQPESEQYHLPDGIVPPIVDAVTFEAVQQQIQRNKELAARNNKNPEDALLRCGLVRCGYCGDKMVVDRKCGGSGKLVVYRCVRKQTRRGVCETSQIAAYILDEAVWQRAVATIRDPSQVIESVNKRRQADPTKDNRKQLKRKLVGIVREIENCTKTHNESKSEAVRKIMLGELERLTREQEQVSQLLAITDNQRDQWKEEQQKLDDFVQWCDKTRAMLDDPTHEISYEEKRNACEIIGLTALVWRTDRRAGRFEITCDPPELSSTIQPISDMHQ